MIPQLYYTLKMSYLTSLEFELRQMRNKLNELHTLEGNAVDPGFKDLEELDEAYLGLLSTVQRLRTEVEPLATAS